MTERPLSSRTTPARVGVELVELRRDDGHPIDALGGADHYYRGQEGDLAAAIAAFLADAIR